jgi:CheY-like chemotaxis protein
MNVLVIDDERLLRDLLGEFLELLGHESDLAAAGRESLARFEPRVHQAVLTDFLMPGMTGIEDTWTLIEAALDTSRQLRRSSN